MGVIENKRTGEQQRLPPRMLVGRSSQADLRLSGSWVSGEHAVVSWDGLQWRIRDLGSRNGTTLDGRPLETRSDHAMKPGGVLAFGQAEEQWVLADATAPIPLAQGPEMTCVESIDRVLTLPDESHPEASIYREGDRWLIETEAGEREVTDRDTVIVGDRIWHLRLPEAREATASHIGSRRLSDIRLELAVSRDEELVQVRLLGESHRIILDPRTHHYLMVVLARHAIEQRAQGHADEDAGWLDPDQLASMLKLGRQSINVYIHRIRAQFAEAGIFDGKAIIERQPQTFALRLAPIDMDVVAL